MIDERSMCLGVDFLPGVHRLEGFHLSEKMNGCRAFWDGSQAWTRNGGLIRLPERIRATLPQGRTLDGEVWAGRGPGRFSLTSIAVRLNRWDASCQFVAFDCPDVPGTWRQRITEAGRIYSRVVKFWEFTGWRETNAMLADIQRLGGEGLVCREPTTSFYPTGRSETFLKLKSPIL